MSGKKGFVSAPKKKRKSKCKGTSGTTNASGNPTLTTTASSTVASSKRKTTSKRTSSFVSPGGSRSAMTEMIAFTDVKDEDEYENGSKPSNVWCEGIGSITSAQSADKSTVTLVVIKEVFPMAKFLHKDRELMFSRDKRSICQFVLERCNLHVDISQPNYWRSAKKFVTQTINRLRNDRNTAMKWAMLGKYHWRYEM
jgi:hypothetical protein